MPVHHGCLLSICFIIAIIRHYFSPTCRADSPSFDDSDDACPLEFCYYYAIILPPTISPPPPFFEMP